MSRRSLSGRLSPISGWVDRHAIGLAIGAITALIILGGWAIIAAAGLNEIPAWWQRADSLSANDPATREQAEHLENAITTQLTQVRAPNDPRWPVAINPQQANAWLAVRLIDTIVTHFGEDAWPDEIERVRIWIEDDRLIIGARALHASGSTVIWAQIESEIDEQGVLWVRISSLHAGTTHLPVFVLATMSREMPAGARFRIGPARIELGDGRVARLIGVRVSGGRLEFVMETLAEE